MSNIVQYEIYSRRRGYNCTTTDLEEAYALLKKMDNGWIIAVSNGKRTKLS